MPSSYNTAYQETLAKLNTALLADSRFADLPIEWPNVLPTRTTDQSQPTENPAPWARVQYQIASNIQKSIGSAGPESKRRYEVKGLLTVSYHATTGYGLSAVGALSQYLYDEFMGFRTASGVFYKPQPVRDVQQVGLWYRSDVMIQFQYDEIR
jgi:hypothetical protein